MGKQNKRIDTGTDQGSLTDNPFAQLAGLKGELPKDAAAQPKPIAEIIKESDLPKAWRVAKTRKGGWPVRVEKRAAGKVVTVLGPVAGDRKALLKHLRKQCSAGGQIIIDKIEIQGDHTDKISALLDTQ